MRMGTTCMLRTAEDIWQGRIEVSVLNDSFLVRFRFLKLFIRDFYELHISIKETFWILRLLGSCSEWCNLNFVSGRFRVGGELT